MSQQQISTVETMTVEQWLADDREVCGPVVIVQEPVVPYAQWWPTVAGDCNSICNDVAMRAQSKYGQDDEKCIRFIREVADQIEGLADTWTDDQ